MISRPVAILLLPTLAATGCVIALSDPKVQAPAGGAQSSSPSGGAGSSGSSSEPPSEKPLPDGEWVNVTGNLAGLASVCGDLSGLAVRPDDGALFAGVAEHGTFVRDEAGQAWNALGTDPGSAAVSGRTVSFVFDPAQRDTWWVASIYGERGVYRTTDNGHSFAALGSISHIDTLAIDFSDSARKVIVAAGHETSRTAYRSTDGGETWSKIGEGLPGDRGCQAIVALSASHYLIGCDYGGEGIFRTTDSGETWQMVSADGGSKAPLRASDGAYYWMRPGGGGLVRSDDGGESWAAVANSVQLLPVSPIQLPDARIAALSARSVVASADRGSTWEPVSAELPYRDVSGFVYSDAQRAFFIKHFDCAAQDAVPADAVMRFAFDNPRQ